MPIEYDTKDIEFGDNIASIQNGLIYWKQRSGFRKIVCNEPFKENKNKLIKKKIEDNILLGPNATNKSK
ncbi:45570_t:CDS:2 [Gigaspora margarita]|uniref:45570_t:CDS:1 n=1 Tax=Gigaspora margarita TaxID=4874 RepID=A0ABM8VZ72_GIGMA|nr:45570_t:CDS:2 [Gigaspora margarita]